MAAHEEREEKGATREEDDAGEEAASKLKLAAHYVMLGFAPLVAVAALVVALMAMSGNRASEEQANKAIAAADSLGKSLEATKSEMEMLRLAIAQEKNGDEEERRKQDELAAKIVQNISQLQTKLKVSPTLELQLQPPASAPVAAPAAAPAAAPGAAAGATGVSRKPAPEVQAIKEAIEKFNRQ